MSATYQSFRRTLPFQLAIVFGATGVFSGVDSAEDRAAARARLVVCAILCGGGFDATAVKFRDDAETV